MLTDAEVQESEPQTKGTGAGGERNNWAPQERQPP